jgi:hypothetical protein
MKQSNFSLADVLAVLTALAFGFICFLGKNFLTLGNTSESIAWGVIIAVSLGGTAFIAKSLKRTSNNFKRNFILEIIVLLLFTSLMVYYTCLPFSHYFTVSDKKTEIQNKLLINIKQAEDMFLQYELYAENRKIVYQSTLYAVIALRNPGELEKYDIRSNVSYDSQIANKIYIQQTDLLPPNYSDTITNKGIKEVAIAWLKNAKSITNNWKTIGIVNVVNDVEKNSLDWLNQLIAFSKLGEKEPKHNDFQKKLSFDDVKKYFSTQGKQTPLSISLSVVAYFLMLFSYMISKRSSKTTIGKPKEKGKYDIDL